MARVSEEARQRFNGRIQQYKREIDALDQRSKSISQSITDGDPGASAKRFTVAEKRLAIASHFLVMNAASENLLGVKNEKYLGEGRKICYDAVIKLEEVVSNYIDVPFSEYEDRHETLTNISTEQRYNIARKLGYTIAAVEDAYGKDSKWHWSFVELEGRLAAVVKNLMNLRTVVAGLDPRAEGYRERLAHLDLAKQLLQRAADRYREKYELSTQRADDFRQAIAYLNALRRIHIILGEADDSERVKKQAAVWKTRMEADEHNRESGKRSSAGA